jgi:hypothetical protein
MTVRTYSCRWIDENIANTIVPDGITFGGNPEGGDVPIFIGNADAVSVYVVTDGAAGSTFDVHMHNFPDGTNQDTELPVIKADIWAALPIAKKSLKVYTDLRGYNFVKMRLDVNTANMGSGKTTTVVVKVYTKTSDKYNDG